MKALSYGRNVRMLHCSVRNSQWALACFDRLYTTGFTDAVIDHEQMAGCKVQKQE